MRHILSLLLTTCLTLSISALESGYDDLWESGGTFFKDPKNKYIQEARILGRAQWQFARVEGDDFSGNYEELRRSRIGVETKFLNYFRFQGNVNLHTGGINNIAPSGYKQMHDVFLTTDLKGLANLSYFDALKLTVGRVKINIGQEVRTSSKETLAVQRSAITGKLRPTNPTGFNIVAEKSSLVGELGLYANSKVDEFDLWTRESNGSFVYGSLSGPLNTGRLTLDFTYSMKDMNDTTNAAAFTQWGSSLYYENSYSDTDVAYSLYLGDNGNLDDKDKSGLFYGASILTSSSLTKKLELIGRAYYWASSEAEGVQLNSRYAALSAVDRRGNKHGSLYAGLNYYLHGHHSKIMTGLEWERLSGENSAQEATTLWTAYRMYF